MSSEKQSQRRLSCAPCFDALWFCYSPVHQMQQYYRLGTLDNCSKKWSALVDCLTLKTKRSSEVESRTGHWDSHFIAFASNEVADYKILFSFLVEHLFKDVNRKTIFLKSLDTKFVVQLTRFFEAGKFGNARKSEAYIWTIRTPKEAAANWSKLFGHLDEE